MTRTALEEALKREKEATSKVLLILTNESSSSKAAFLALRRAMAEGEEAHRGLTSELEEAIAATEKAVDSRFASMVGEWEKENTYHNQN
ncbi:MAG: hypothetical protein SGPRY_014371 [Prymnesium sp.]